MSNLMNRLTKLEEKLNPGMEIIVVDQTEGENVDEKIIEKEKELGMTLKKDKIILVIVRDFTEAF